MRFIITLFLLGLVKVSFCQVTCIQFSDSLHLTSDTVFVDQQVDSTIDLGIQWMGHTDLSYMVCWINHNDSANISLNGGTVTGGLFSPYPNPVFFSVDIQYLQQSIPVNTSVVAYIDFIQSNMADTCRKAITFIINPITVSVPESNLPNLEARLFPNPMTNSSVLEISDELISDYRVVIYNSMGFKIFESDSVNDRVYMLDRSIFNSSGLYFVELNSQGSKSGLMKLIVD